jgi:hypothetical protein
MSETTEYNDMIIMETMKKEISEKLGEEAWDMLTQEIGTPDIQREAMCGCQTMREFMKRFDAITDKASAKEILTHVRHGLKHSQFAWAREKFAQYNNIDEFINVVRKEQMQLFKELCETGNAFYGQIVNEAVLDYVVHEPGMLSPVRKGSELHITAFPFNISEYIKETDLLKKRYYACHCPFARESILSENATVSKTLCYCSLGHAKVMWEAIFDRELDAELAETALAGDMMCKYIIFLPDEIIDKYT